MKVKQEFLPMALQTGLPFGAVMAILFSFINGFEIGVPIGVVCGLAFGVAIAIFAQRQQTKMVSESGLFEGEQVYLEGPANHFLNREGRGGWLTLTPTRLAFRSHGHNVQNVAAEWPLAQIERAEAVRTMGIIPNGLKVHKQVGGHEFFVVANRKAWMEEINLRR